MISTQTLVLTASMAPHKIVSWQRAVTMMMNGKVRVLREYDEVIGKIPLDLLEDFEALVDALPDHAYGEELTIKMPAVIALTRDVNQKKRRIQFSRLNVFTRDGFRCQYCGSRMRMTGLNYDHVTPKDQGGRTVWENIVSSCYPCNSMKANRTPSQAGMRLRREPFKPKWLPVTTLHVDMSRIPPLWEEFYSLPGSEEDTNRDQGEN
jgi:5-methylcytosine-specific restriction endonuclease McrA